MRPLLARLKSWLLSLFRRYPGHCRQVILHYRRRKADYAGWGLHIWGDGLDIPSWDEPLAPTTQDDFGITWVIHPPAENTALHYIIHHGDEKDPDGDQTLVYDRQGCEIWLAQGQEKAFTNPADALAALVIRLRPAPRPKTHQICFHYHRPGEDYDNWGLHLWAGSTQLTSWERPLRAIGQDEYGIYWLVNFQPKAKTLNYILHKGNLKDPGPDQTVDILTMGNDIYLIQNSNQQFTNPEQALEASAIAEIGDIRQTAEAYWLTRTLIAWPRAKDPLASYTLHYSEEGNLKITRSGIIHDQHFPLTWVRASLPDELAEKYPHLRHAALLKIPDQFTEPIPQILLGEFALSMKSNSKLPNVTSLQIPGVLDDLYAHEARRAALGLTWQGALPTLRVWAPTARSVCLVLYPNSDSDPQNSQRFPMTRDHASGVWEITGPADWHGRYYCYDVEVFVRQAGQFIHNIVTDPYSISLSTNSLRSQIVRLDAPELLPDAWKDMVKPPLAAFTDIVLYELHLRDFSATDASLPPHERGTYLAFTHPEANGMKHLRRLAEAGLTHVHLMPVFDIATINEDKSTWKQVDFDLLAQYPPDSAQQQAAVMAVRESDGFNWGYDPFHYTTPEGAYAVQPDGATRLLEFRQMVAGLNQIGLRVVMDVVYNHTRTAGQDPQSVLDRIVPGYYYRLDEKGYICTSTCCPNTATEHAMMEKLMLDSLKTWATQYKVDGFRFDLMGHHMLENMCHVRAMLDSLTLERDGVDGKKIYVYGEGWDFGEVAGNARGINATQYNTAGTSIGTFNDRLRDATRGGNPFGDVTEQGYLTGMYTDPNEADAYPPSLRLEKLQQQEDQIRVALAGNLASYLLVNRLGQVVQGDQIGYRGSCAGYTYNPEEHIAYISAHDNESLFDSIQYKAPLRLSTAERARMQKLGLSLLLLSQGIPFLDAGSELLRSKSMDRDSYNSGDWFNKLDFTYQHNNWGVGLPLKDINGHRWPVIQPRLANPALAATPADILATRDHTLEMLRIRRASPLFRLPTTQDIFQRVKFFNNGPGRIPGLIVMALDDNPPLPDLDPEVDLIVVLFNAEDTPVRYQFSEVSYANLHLHPIQAQSLDPLVRTATFEASHRLFTIPGRNTAVFVGQGVLPPSLHFTHGV